MFTIKHYSFIITLLSTLCFTTLTAQDDIDRNVTVERDFQPIVEDAGKITSLPEIIQISTAKERVYYSEINQPLPFDKSILPLSPEEILINNSPKELGAYLRLGVGNHWNTLGDLALPIIRKDKSRLDLLLNHSATFGEKQHSVSQANLNFNYFFHRYDLYAGVNFAHEYFNYYGHQFNAVADAFDLNDFSTTTAPPNLTYKELQLERITRSPQEVKLTDLANAPQTEMLWRYNAHVGIRTLPTAKGVKHAGEINYDLLDTNNGLQEHIVSTTYGFSNPVGRNRFGMDFDLSNMFYRQNNMPAINFWDYYAVFAMNPYYMIEHPHWYLRAGVKAAFSFIHGRPFNPMPDVSTEWKILPNYLSVYGGITGSFTPSTLSSMYKENRYIYPDLRVKDYYVPVNPYFGFKLKPAYNFILDAYAEYRFINDQYFFVNKAYRTNSIGGNEATLFTNRFNAIYSDVNLFRYGIRMNYHYKNIVNVQMKGAYNDWRVVTERYAWMKPAIQADLSADVRIDSHLTLSTAVFYEGKCYAKFGTEEKEMTPKVDINLSATYAFNRTWSAFAKVNNLLNSKYEAFYGYQVQGINFLLGGAVSF